MCERFCCPYKAPDEAYIFSREVPLHGRHLQNVCERFCCPYKAPDEAYIFSREVPLHGRPPQNVGSSIQVPRHILSKEQL